MNLLEEAMTSLIENWRYGNDHVGFHHFIQMLQLLEDLVNNHLDRFEEKSAGELIGLVPIVQGLHQFVQNRDVIGMTDLVEFHLLPFIREWQKDVNLDVDKVATGS